MTARSMLRVGTLACLTIVVLGACSSSDKANNQEPAGPDTTRSAPTSTRGASTAASDTACAFFDADEVRSLFGTQPQHTSDPLNIGGTASNCLWKADAGGKQYLLQVGLFDGPQHYAESDRSGAENLAGLGDKAFIKQGGIGGVTIESVRDGTTYFVLFSIAKTSSATANDANAKADQLLALIKRKLPPN